MARGLPPGFKFSQETIEKMRAAALRRIERYPHTAYQKGRTCEKSFAGKTHTPEVRERIRQSKLGQRNPQYGKRKASVSYGTVHDWLKEKFGQPNNCEHCGSTTQKRYEWAKKRGCEYERKRENFIRLCKKCHNDYDEVNAWQNKKKASCG